MRRVNRVYPVVFIAAVLFGVFWVHLLVNTKLPATGDEPRYVYYAVSVLKGQFLHLSTEDWQRYAAEYGHLVNAPGHAIFAHAGSWINPFNKTTYVGHSFVSSLMMLPWMATLGFDGARYAAVSFGALGVFFMYLTLMRVFRFWIAAVALVVALMGMPLVGQIHLANAEPFLFGLFSAAWYFAAFSELTIPRFTAAVILICMLPFVHVRGVTFSVILGGILFWRVVKEMQADLPRRRAGLLLAIACATIVPATVVFVIYNLSFFGTWTGHIETPVKEFPISLLAHRLDVHLFHHRDGILPCFPAAFFAALGVVIAARKRPFLCAQLALFAVASLAIFVWQSNSESLPARYYTVLFPIIAMGLGLFLEHSRSRVFMVLFVAATLVTAVNAALFVVNPGLFFVNRQFSATWEVMREMAPFFEVNRYIIWDSLLSPPGYVTHVEQAMALGYKDLALLALLAIAGILTCFSRQPLVRRSADGAAALMGALIVLSVAAIPVKPQGFTVERTSSGAHQALDIRFRKPVARSLTVRYGNNFNLWYPPGYPPDLQLSVLGESGRRFVTTHRTVPIIQISAPEPILAIDISGSGGATEWTAGPVQVMERLPIL